MSTLQTINVKHPSSASNNLVLDSSGNATIASNATIGGNATIAGSMVAGSSYAWRNRIINGDMRIDQRNNGASVTPTTIGSTYTLDRWSATNSQASKYSVQQSSVTPSGQGFSNSLIATSLSSYSVSSGDYFYMVQFVEGYNTSDFMWGTANAISATLSFWVRSSLTGTFVVAVRSGSDDAAYPATYTVNAANTWERKTITIPGPTSGTFNSTNSRALGLWFSLGAGSAFNATANVWAGGGALSVSGSQSVVGTNGATWYVTGVQLEPGTAATPFERRDYGRELILCQRYFEKTSGIDCRGTGTLWRVPYFWKVVKRGAPTVSFFGADGVTPNVITQDGTNRAAYIVAQNIDMCSAESNVFPAGAIALTAVFVGNSEL